MPVESADFVEELEVEGSGCLAVYFGRWGRLERHYMRWNEDLYLHGNDRIDWWHGITAHENGHCCHLKIREANTLTVPSYLD